MIIACGSSSNTHGVPGLEHCFQLKTVSDAQCIRRRIMGESRCVGGLTVPHILSLTDNFEMASLPTTSPEERKRLLSFVVCGGGPTGVETAAVFTFLYWIVSETLTISSYRKSTISAKRIS